MKRRVIHVNLETRENRIMRRVLTVNLQTREYRMKRTCPSC